jgi:hypothetical protein
MDHGESYMGHMSMKEEVWLSKCCKFSMTACEQGEQRLRPRVGQLRKIEDGHRLRQGILGKVTVAAPVCSTQGHFEISLHVERVW